MKLAALEALQLFSVQFLADSSVLSGGLSVHIKLVALHKDRVGLSCTLTISSCIEMLLILTQRPILRAFGYYLAFIETQ